MSLLERMLLKVFPHFDIVKNGDLYLRRFMLFTSRFGNVYVHHIARGDDDPDPHDHPWDFMTLILRGGYRNDQYAGFKEIDGDFISWGDPEGEEYCRAGSLHIRSAEHCHQVKFDDKTAPDAWTLVVTGPRRRDWNFITPQGPVFWREYLNDWEPRGHD